MLVSQKNESAFESKRLLSCAAGAPNVTSPAANTLATAVATAAQQNPTAAAQVIASASSRAHPVVLHLRSMFRILYVYMGFAVHRYVAQTHFRCSRLLIKKKEKGRKGVFQKWRMWRFSY